MNEEEQKTYDQLISKAKESFILAIEIYNRPSIRYRVEGFSFFICNAWELMLKAKILKDNGKDAIYYKDSANRTKSLEKCIELVFTNAKSPIRKNLEAIIQLRNTSTHFIVEEHEQIYVGLFQSCVMNFDDKMFEFHKVNMSDSLPSHFLTLSMSANPATPEIIRAKYSPEVAEKFLFDENEILQEQLLQANQGYSVVIRTELAVIKDTDKADLTVAYDSTSDNPIRTASVFKDPRNTHPLSVKNVIAHVNNRLKKMEIDLKSSGESKAFTQNDWSLFMKFYGLKDNQEYGYPHKIGESQQYTYSMKTVDLIVDLIKENPDGVIDDLKSAMKKGTKPTPGAKDSKP